MFLKHILFESIDTNNINPFYEGVPLNTAFIIGSILIVISVYLIIWYIFRIKSKTTHKNLLSAFTFLMIPSFAFLFLGITLLARGIWEFQEGVPNYYIPLKLSSAFLVPWFVLFAAAITCYVLYRKKK